MAKIEILLFLALIKLRLRVVLYLLKIANRRIKAIRANRSHVMKIVGRKHPSRVVIFFWPKFGSKNAPKLSHHMTSSSL